MFSNEHALDNSLIDKICIAADFICAFNKDIIGYCAMYANDVVHRIAYITLIAVKEQYQNQHVGKTILHYADVLASSKGMKEIQLEVKKDNTKAIAFYTKYGFCIVGDKTNTTYLMCKELIKMGGLQ